MTSEQDHGPIGAQADNWPNLDQQIAGLDGVLQSGSPQRRLPAIDPGDDYLERMVKYIPAEMHRLFDADQRDSRSGDEAGGTECRHGRHSGPRSSPQRALLVGCMLTPLFCWYVRQDGDAWMRQRRRFHRSPCLFWAYLIGAVAFANIHDGNLAAILVMTFTVVSGLVAPWPDKAAAERAQQRSHAPMEKPRLVNASGDVCL